MRGRHFFGRGFWKWGYPLYTGFYRGPFYFGGGRGRFYPFCRRFWWHIPLGAAYNFGPYYGLAPASDSQNPNVYKTKENK